jgi:hypothetical protein
VECATSSHAQSERTDLGVSDINAGRALSPHSNNVPVLERIDDGLLDPTNQLAYADAEPTQIDQWISDDLAGTVIRHLSAALDLDHRDIAGGQYVFWFSSLPECEHGLVLQQPKFIGRLFITLIGEATHRFEYGLVRLPTKTAHKQRLVHHCEMGLAIHETSAMLARNRYECTIWTSWGARMTQLPHQADAYSRQRANLIASELDHRGVVRIPDPATVVARLRSAQMEVLR